MHASTLDGTATTPGTSTSVIVQEIWTHAAVTYDASNLIFYINGSPDGTTTNTRNPANGTMTLKVGARGNDAGSVLAGYIDEVRVWGDARSAAEILANYQNQARTSAR